jgi:hypothetical protein
LSDTRVSIRIGVDGAAEVKGALADIGKTGDQAFAQVASGAEKANAAIDKQAERYKRLAEAARVSLATDQTQVRVNELLGVKTAQPGPARVSAQVFEEELKQQESLAARARALREAIDPTAAAYRKMGEAIAEAGHLLARGGISHSEHAAAVTLAKNAFQQAEAGAKRLSGELTHQAEAVGLNRMQMLELAHVGRALFDELVAGANPLRALALEGGRISQIFALSPGGAGGTLKAFGAELAGLVTPARAMGAAIAAMGATAVAALLRWQKAQDALAVSLNGLGRASGLTLNELDRIAERGASLSGISIAAAQGLASQYLSAGVRGDSLGDLIGITRDYSKKLGLSFEDAAMELAHSLAEPAKGAEELAKKYGLLSFAQRHEIEELAAIGDRSGASAKLVADLGEQLGKMYDPTWKLTKALENVGAGFSDWLTRIGKALTVPDSDAMIAERSRQADASKRQARIDEAADDISGLVKSILPETIKFHELELAREKFERALGIEGVTGALEKAGISGETARHAFENLSFQAAHWQSAIDKIREDSILSARASEAWTFAERANVVADQARISVLRESGDSLRAAAEAEKARNQLIAEGNRRAEERI